MVYALEVERVMKETKTSMSSRMISDMLKFDVNNEETRFSSPSACAIKLNELKKKGIVKFSHKAERLNFYVLTTAEEQKEFLENPVLPTLNNGKSIPEKYVPIFTIQPINDNVCETIQNIRYKILESGELTPEQEDYVNQIMIKLVQEEEEELKEKNDKKATT